MNIRFLFTLLVCLSLAFSTYYFQSRYAAQKLLTAQVEKKLALSIRLIEDLQKRQRDVADLDSRYTRELANAQRTIEDLQRDVAGGAKRLHVAAGCPKLPAGSTAARLDDAAGARLTDAAERDYFRLRSRIELASKQLAGLQDYVRQQCLRRPDRLITTETADE